MTPDYLALQRKFTSEGGVQGVVWFSFGVLGFKSVPIGINTANLEGLKGLHNEVRTSNDCSNTQPCCILSTPQYIQFSVKPYLPSVPQNVNPRDGVAFGADLFDGVSKEKSFVNCYPDIFF